MKKASLIFLVSVICLVGATRGAWGTANTFTVTGTFEARTTRVMSEVSAPVEAVLVDKGDTVRAGQVVIRLDPGPLRQQIQEAEAALKAAQAHLADLEAQPLPASVEVAEAQLEDARAGVRAAEKQVQVAQDALQNPVSIDNQIRLVEAQRNLLQEQLDAARARHKQAQVTYDYYRTILTDEGRMRAAIAQKQLQAAASNLAAVQAEIAGTERLLKVLQDIREHPLALESQAHQAEGQQRLAQAQVTVAEKSLALAKAPARAEEIRQAQAQVAQAQATVKVLQSRLAQYTLTAPTGGTVIERTVNPGEVAQAGQALLEIGDLRVLDLIVYVPEPELGKISLGQSVTVHVDAFPGRAFQGHVVWIADEAEFTPKNVQTKGDRMQTVFRVQVVVPNEEGLLKAGMPADVTFTER